MKKYIDIGVNLFDKQFRGREQEIVTRAEQQDVGIIITGCSLADSKKAAAFVKGKEGIYSTAGIHPHNAKNCSDDTIGCLRDILTKNKNVIAVGECGLDYDRMFSPKEEQLKWFERQIELAEECNLPLFLHERSADDDFLKIMKRHRSVCTRAVVHCFTGSRGTALRYLNLGCYIGITGWICDSRRNGELKDALTVIPKERLLLETDAPYLTPRNVPGLSRTNVPENIVYVAREVAKLKKMDEDELIQIVRQNTKKLFGI